MTYNLGDRVRLVPRLRANIERPGLRGQTKGVIVGAAQESCLLGSWYLVWVPNTLRNYPTFAQPSDLAQAFLDPLEIWDIWEGNLELDTGPESR